MTVHGDSDKSGGMRSSLTITWRPTDIPDLLEARLVDNDGAALYAGYIVRRVGEGDDEWHGYVGMAPALVGIGTRAVVQAAVEQVAREVWATHGQTGKQGVT